MALLKSIGNLKASGLDGMPALFYREYWEEIAERVTEEVLHVLNGGPIYARALE